MTTKTLAWHETLELHELIAAQSVGLVKIKKSMKKISDPQLRQLYSVSAKAKALEQNLRELLPFCQKLRHFSGRMNGLTCILMRVICWCWRKRPFETMRLRSRKRRRPSSGECLLNKSMRPLSCMNKFLFYVPKRLISRL